MPKDFSLVSPNLRFKRSGKTTKKRGVTYRSKLESEWAEFFREHDWIVQYEPGRILYAGGSYLPDFLWSNPHITSDKRSGGFIAPQVYIEIKPTIAIAAAEVTKAYPALRKMDMLLVLCGYPPKKIKNFAPQPATIQHKAVDLLGFDVTWEYEDGRAEDYNRGSLEEATHWRFLLNAYGRLFETDGT